MNKQFLIAFILLCSIRNASGFLDYTSEYLLDCKEEHTNQELSDTLIIHQIDRWVFICLAPFALMSTIFVIFTFIKYPTTRKQPGDIILAISISDLIVCIHWLISSSYAVIYNIGPDPDGAFCQTNAFFSCLAGTTEFTYNCCFCMYIIFVIRNNLKGQNIPQKIFHLVCCGITVAMIIFTFSTNYAGLSLFGTCSVKVNDGFPVAGVVFLFIYLFVSWYTIWYFRKTIPDNATFKKMRNEFLRYYFYYVVSTSLIWTVLASSNLFAALNCSYFQNPSLNVIITIGNAAKIITPIILSVIRYKDPTIEKKVRDQLIRWKIIKKNRNSIFDPLNPQTAENNGPNMDQISLSEQDRRSSSEEGINWLAKLAQNLRMTQIYTMICGLVINDLQMKQFEEEDKQKMKQTSINSKGTQIYATNPLVALKDEDYTNSREVELHDALIHKHIPQHQHNEKSPSIEAKMVVHAPKVFRALQLSDGVMANVSQTFDLVKNLQAIQKKFGGPDGGKSGEFFYFAYDRKMIIKTMGKGELDVFLKYLKDYVQHLIFNENSLIVKIYGVYSFTINQVDNHILVMRNITQCSGEYILRTFDLKGSSHDREVLANKKNKEKDLSEMTLKDIDFNKTEQKVWIPLKESQICSAALERDARFFEKCGLIDYSLIVFKINWSKYSIDTGIEIDDALKCFHTSLNAIESTKEVGVYYHLGIIDYLQEWNMQKTLEKNTKQIIHLKGNLDTSAQNQKIYADRFVTEIAKGIFQV